MYPTRDQWMLTVILEVLSPELGSEKSVSLLADVKLVLRGSLTIQSCFCSVLMDPHPHCRFILSIMKTTFGGLCMCSPCSLGCTSHIERNWSTCKTCDWSRWDLVAKLAAISSHAFVSMFEKFREIHQKQWLFFQ